MKINMFERTIVLTKKEMNAASRYGSVAYKELQNARRDNPDYRVVTVTKTVKTQRETYKGLTYAYMERYIETHENAEEVMAEYRELRLISECHGKARSYPAIKKWFLKMYPEVENFRIEESDNEATAETSAKYEAVMAPLVESNMAEEYALVNMNTRYRLRPPFRCEKGRPIFIYSILLRSQPTAH